MTTPVSQRLPLTTQRSLIEPNNDVTIDMNLPSSDLNVEQLPQSSGRSSPNESNNNNNENRKSCNFGLGEVMEINFNPFNIMA